MGRWQKNKDLSWYAKGDTSQAATDAATARAEEIRRIKEAEQDALSEALGFPIQPHVRDSQLAGQKEVEKALKETAEGDEEGGRGVGFGSYVNTNIEHEDSEEVMRGHSGDIGGLSGGRMKNEKLERRRQRSRSPARKHERRRRSRSRYRDIDRERRHRRHHAERRHDEEDGRSHRRYRSNSRDRYRHKRSP